MKRRAETIELMSSKTENHIYVATERVVPLNWSVRRKSLSVETCKWGLFTVAVLLHFSLVLPTLSSSFQTTLAFIHDEAVSVHGNVRLASIFTSKSGEWRLGGFETLSSMKDDDAIIYVGFLLSLTHVQVVDP